MKNNIESLVSLNKYFESLNLNYRQRKAAVDIIEKTGALIEVIGMECINIHIYTDSVLATLDCLKSEAIASQALENLTDYKYSARSFLEEWAFFAENISHQITDGKNTRSFEGVAESLKKMMDDMRTIFEHLITAEGLFIEFGLANRKSDPPGLEIE